MGNSAYLLGYDIGSSSIKATLLDAAGGAVVASAASPGNEMPIIARQAGWAEQDPAMWWENVRAATAQIRRTAGIDLRDVCAIGIAYQMHGLVIVDKNHQVLRPAIIWCDSRAVPYGEKAFAGIGTERCLKSLLNSPGNFTASKLAWVKENEPAVFAKIDKMMLPGDYIALKLGGAIATTPSGLSEGILWDFKEQGLAGFVLDYFGFSRDIVPAVLPAFGTQGEVTRQAAEELGLKALTPIAYRGGDQPNNALSLNVLNPGEIAATAGTSGVVYGVVDSPRCDALARVNTFVHVNYSPENPRYGILLCCNGTGILNSWLRRAFFSEGGQTLSYPAMNALAAQAPVGAAGLMVLPYGNGAERTLENRNIGASVHGLEFNRHTRAHVLRAAQEGIVFALAYGLDIMRTMGVAVRTIRAGESNMFLSPLFRSVFAAVTNVPVELYNTDGAQGAARGAGIGAGIYKNFKEAFAGLKTTGTVGPDRSLAGAYKDEYQKWVTLLKRNLSQGVPNA
ncbi:MAG: FGGY family carbohydrate kinase [Chitinivibrionales bacterium]|nr:FGGY family carbohydrate kinase [Chitinivibrionales bacterium]